jgi:hypothetical protein
MRMQLTFRVLRRDVSMLAKWSCICKVIVNTFLSTSRNTAALQVIQRSATQIILILHLDRQ